VEVLGDNVNFLLGFGQKGGVVAELY